MLVWRVVARSRMAESRRHTRSSASASPPEVILWAVRWYLRFALSFRDLEGVPAERGVRVDHVSLHRWVLRFIPGI